MACSGARTHFKSIYIIPDLKSRYIVITPEQAGNYAGDKIEINVTINKIIVDIKLCNNPHNS